MPFFGNESALFSRNRSVLVSGTIELIYIKALLYGNFVFRRAEVFLTIFQLLARLSYIWPITIVTNDLRNLAVV